LIRTSSSMNFIIFFLFFALLSAQRPRGVAVYQPDRRIQTACQDIMAQRGASLLTRLVQMPIYTNILHEVQNAPPTNTRLTIQEIAAVKAYSVQGMFRPLNCHLRHPFFPSPIWVREIYRVLSKGDCKSPLERTLKVATISRSSLQRITFTTASNCG